MRLGDLIQAAQGLRPITPIDPSLRVCDVTEDSRTAVPGSFFIARPGTASDGRRFLAQAAEAGAVAAIVQRDEAAAAHGPDRRPAPDVPANLAVLESADAAASGATLAEAFYAAPSARLALVGVTGTNGKSTIAHLIHRALNAAGTRTGLIGTVEIDDGVALAPAEMTTPPATEISRTLALMADNACQAAAMEVSSHALDQRRVHALRFRAAIFTNLTRDHLNYHHTMDAYAAAKARLFDSLAPDALAIVNADDPAWPRMIEACRAPVLRCSMDGASEADATAEILGASLESTTLRLTGPWGTRDLSTPLIGRHNAMNLLQALAAIWHIARGLPDASAFDRAATALARVPAPAGRLERVSLPADELTVMVDYAHTPDAMASVLRAVRAVAGSRPIAIVFGAGGDKDKGKRPLIGRVAAELADRVIITSDNPRSEPPRAIIAEIIEGIDAAKRPDLEVHADRERAIHAAIADADLGQIIIIAGKGHETEQVSVDAAGRPLVRHFDDREIARTALKLRRAARPAPTTTT